MDWNGIIYSLLSIYVTLYKFVFGYTIVIETSLIAHCIANLGGGQRLGYGTM